MVPTGTVVAVTDATSSPDPRTSRTTYSEVLRVPEFRALFAARTVSITAISLRILAVSVLVLEATDSPLMSGLAFGIGFFPQIVGGMTLLSLADRLRPRRALVLGSLLEAAAALVIVLAGLPPWAVLVLLAATAVLAPVFTAAANGLVPELLTGDRYVLGRSLLTMSSSASQIAGLALGGVAIALLDPRGALVLSCVLHLVSAAVARLSLADRPGRRAKAARGTVRETWTGNRSLLGDRRIRGQVLVQTVPPALVTGAEGLVVAYVAATHLPDGAAGPLLACLPIGMAVGNLAVGRFLAPDARERAALPLLLVLGLPLLLFFASPPLVVSAALLLVTGVAFAYELGVQRRFLESVPEAMRGQAFGLVGTLMMFGQGMAPVLFGALASLWSPSIAIGLCGVTVLLAAAALTSHLKVAGVPAEVAPTVS